MTVDARRACSLCGCAAFDGDAEASFCGNCGHPASAHAQTAEQADSPTVAMPRPGAPRPVAPAAAGTGTPPPTTASAPSSPPPRTAPPPFTPLPSRQPITSAPAGAARSRRSWALPLIVAGALVVLAVVGFGSPRSHADHVSEFAHARAAYVPASERRLQGAQMRFANRSSPDTPRCAVRSAVPRCQSRRSSGRRARRTARRRDRSRRGIPTCDAHPDRHAHGRALRLVGCCKSPSSKASPETSATPICPTTSGTGNSRRSRRRF